MTSSNESGGSVTRRIKRISSGEEGTPQSELFDRYYQTVIQKAKYKLNRLAVVDASDVAASVWGTIFQGMASGKFQCADREEFEELLGRVTYFKAINLYNWMHRKKRILTEELSDHELYRYAENSLSDNCRKVAEMYYLDGKSVEVIANEQRIDINKVEEELDQIRKVTRKQILRMPSTEVKTLEEIPKDSGPLEVLMFEELLAELDEKLRETVLLKLRGYSNVEVANSLDISERQVRRRLELVRTTLESHISNC